jgi:hypothetical protein
MVARQWRSGQVGLPARLQQKPAHAGHALRVAQRGFAGGEGKQQIRQQALAM